MMSIRARFALVSLVSVTLALSLAAWLLVALFAESFGRRIDAELASHISRLAGALEFTANGMLEAPESPADNRFYQAYGGLYWQIDDPGRKTELRSPSLFDYALPLPSDEHRPGTIHHYRLMGPEGTEVIVQERVIAAAAPEGPRTIRIAVALDATVLDQAKSAFAGDLIPYVAALAIVLVAMSVVQLRFGLKPLDRVAADLDAVRDRRAERLPGPYPSELAGLAGQVNALLEAQSRTIDKARQRASDLAHGLKTPLTVIANNALTLEERGEVEIAAELEQLADSMLAHVNHELARARIAPSASQRRSDAQPAKIAGDIIRTLLRTEQGELLAWDNRIDTQLSLPIDPHDLRELLGNLLENASKWAARSVTVTSHATPEGLAIMVEDDGPGVAPDRLADLTRRGLRLDDQKPGSGLGLSIVKEIADVYGLTLTLENRPEGGFRAGILFPATPAG